MRCQQCEATLPQDAAFCDSCGAKVVTKQAQDPMLGKVLLNQYVIEQKLGEGGFGAVYLADQPSMGRKVAVKTLHPHLTRNSQLTTRFRREGMAASRLQHPSCVKMYNLGETEDGILWLAMEFVEGQTLDSLLQKNGPLSPQALTEILTPICDALTEAHTKGIVHRDLKPENIMLSENVSALCKSGAQPAPISSSEIKLLDFGIAAIVDDDVVTQTGMISGTPRYMSPEQWKGLKYADAKSDIYSLGMIAYQCLTGRLPFEADTAPGWMQKHCLEQAPNIETLSHQKIPQGVSTAIMKAISKDPKERYEKASDFASALKEGLGSPAVAPRAPIVTQAAPMQAAPMQAAPMPSAERTIPVSPPLEQKPSLKVGLLVGGGVMLFLLLVFGLVSLGASEDTPSGGGPPEAQKSACEPGNSAQCAAACDKGEPTGCFELAEMYYTGRSVPKDASQAALLYEKSCALGYGRGCNNAGVQYAEGEGVGQDMKRAHDFYQLACNKGFHAGCSNLGAIYMGLYDFGRAFEVLSKDCDAGGRESCANLGVLYWYGSGVLQDQEKARSLFKKSCDDGFLTGCEYYKNGPNAGLQ